MNKSMIGFFLTVLGFLSMIQDGNAMLRSLDYDEVRREGGRGFSTDIFSNAYQLVPSKELLKPEEKGDLVRNPYLTKLHTLNLSGQNIDDDFVRALCETKYNPDRSPSNSYRRIIHLNLSRNPLITMRSIDFLLESPVLGSLRDLPQISGRFGCPATTLYVQAKETGISPPSPEEKHFIKHRFNFDIEYRNPITEKQSDTPAIGVKFVEVTL